MTENDRKALQLALDLTLAEDDLTRVEQLQSMLADGWDHAAQFASYHRQCVALRLKPWDDPPCHIDLDDADDPNIEARKLLLEMLALGISRYHPDPLAAIEAAEKR